MKKLTLVATLAVCVLVYFIGYNMRPVFEHHGFWIDYEKTSAGEHRAIAISVTLAFLAVAGVVIAIIATSGGNGKPVFYRSMPRGVKHNIVYRVDVVNSNSTFVVVQNKSGDKPTLVFFDFVLEKDRGDFVVMPEKQRQLYLGITPQTEVIGV